MAEEQAGKWQRAGGDATDLVEKEATGRGGATDVEEKEAAGRGGATGGAEDGGVRGRRGAAWIDG